jgi:hypothetical protein
MSKLPISYKLSVTGMRNKMVMDEAALLWVFFPVVCRQWVQSATEDALKEFNIRCIVFIKTNFIAAGV